MAITNTPGAVETEALLRERGRREHWFRHPYLETGGTVAAKRTFEAWLAAHGYRVAPLTGKQPSEFEYFDKSRP